MIKKAATLAAALLVSGCSMTPYEDLNLDTTSNFKSPSEGMAGVYVYQWKSGIFGAGFDVDFEIKGQPVISLNTGEYGYMEVEPGAYEYKLMGGIFKQYVPVTFEADENYFFRAQLSNASDTAVLGRNQLEIDSAKRNISSGRYEIHDKD